MKNPFFNFDPRFMTLRFCGRTVTRHGLRILAIVCACSCLGAGSSESIVRNLGDMSLEELMNETVTSVSKREQKLSDAAAAIALLSNEDLRRMGASSLPEALRFVPGVEVGAANAQEWSVTARGFGGIFSNKLLVLVDGRAVYSPLFGGVFWNLQQTMLEDVDRVEVIRGPGAAVWGANAVNGVINVVSRSAKDTQGGLLYGQAGTVDETAGGGRYGGRIGTSTYFRAFASYQAHGDHPLTAGGDARDAWKGRHGGFRVDHYSDPDTALTWQMDATRVDFDTDDSNRYNFNTLGRWSRRWSDQSSADVQAYYDRNYLDEVARAQHSNDTVDLTAQRTFGLGARHDIVSGIGYRFVRSQTNQTNPLLSVRNGKFDTDLFSAFVQDEFKLVPDRVTLIAGGKLEHNDFTGFEFQPSVRAVWKPGRRQTLWGAISRAVRTPTGIEGGDVFAITTGAPVQGPDGDLYLPTVVGNGDPSAEVLWAYEAGYRLQPSRRITIDLAAFYNAYDDLIATGNVSRFIPGGPLGIAELPLMNLLDARTYGGEIQLTIAPTETWRLIAGYSVISLQFSGPQSTSNDELVPPRHQVSLRSAYDFSPRASFDAQFRFVDQIPSVPAYFTADVRLSYHFTDRLEISLIGKNLLDPQHPEQSSAFFTTNSEVARLVAAKAVWRF